ncbi:restriction endonuclease subunit S [Azospirillum rugosum]|uniref:Type I restriction enzyme S subunit n=1 Tax=Azospirillum rugosum TaxID=416170 RepID=A0ABS4SYC0_9PROT|nr:restriction endonuclease subunit S [Azospirillum rugosum]MBP2297274.1 type I restriction enzyme S subunit [Azospirillum rugosum]MDQ0531116.1 type I restriction enzyme S subunit [Azospirillum rugosum]
MRVPEGWAKMKIGDLCQPDSEPVSVTQDQTYKLMGVRWYGNGPHLHSEVSGAKLNTNTLNLVKKGQITYNKMWVSKSAFGVTSVEHHGMYATAEYPTFTPRPGLCGDFLRHYMRLESFRVQALSRCRGTTSRARLNPKDFLDLEILLPPISEQRRIAKALTDADEAIEATRAVIEQTLKVKRNMLKRLMSKGIGHSRFKRTEIGNVPAIWDVLPLPNLLREPVRNGYSPVCPTEPTGRWILSLGALTPDGFSAERVKPAPLDDVRLEGATLEDGDVLISRSNTPERVGLAGLYQGIPAPCYYPDLMMRLRFDLNKMMPEFAVAWLSLLQSEGYFAEAASGTSASMVKINRSTLSGVHFPVPSVSEQESLIQRLRQVESVGALEMQKLASMERLKSALLSDLLTGRKRVSADALSAAL